MTIKEFAISRNTPQAKIKKLAQQILGEVPLDFSEEDTRKIDEALGKATVNFLDQAQEYTGKSEKGEGQEDTALSLQGSNALNLNERIREIIGDDLLKENLLLYISFLKKSLQEDRYNLEAAAFQVEQLYYKGLQNYQHSLYEDGKERIRKARFNSLSFCSQQGIKEEIAKNQDPELDGLLTEALSFFQEVE